MTISAPRIGAAAAMAGLLALTGSAAVATHDLPDLPVLDPSTTTTAVAPTTTLPPPPAYRVYFNRFVDGDVDLWRVDPATITGADPDGDAAPLSAANSPGWDYSADVSRDGRTLAFVSDRDGDDEIYVLDLVTPGATPVQLTRNTVPDRGPAWSPDGTSIAYVGQVPIDKRFVAVRVRIMDRDGRPIRTIDDPEPHQHSNVAWSPDGARLVFGAGYEQRSSLFVVATSGEGPQQLTFGSKQDVDRDPDWSPDGAHIAFARTHTTGSNVEHEVLLVPAAGGATRALTSADGAHAFQPSWHPGGGSLLFSGGAVGSAPQLHRLDVGAGGAAGTPAPFLSPAGYDTQPEWAVAAR